MLDETLEAVADAKLTDFVKFWGERKDAQDILQAADALMFPSLYEGLGISAIEAQTSGLPVFASTEVPREAEATDLIKFIPLSDGAASWAEQILDDMARLSPRRGREKEIAESGYDINSAAAKLQEFYLSACGRAK